MSKYFLGVDGGQSATVALAADETGRVLGIGRGGPCNHVTGEQKRRKIVAALRECMDSLFQACGLAPDVQFESACFGFSGGAEDKRALLPEVVASRFYLATTDAAIALVGATGGEPGIITIAGTGSISHGRNAEGRTARAGGWGYVFGDEGGAFDIFRQALRAVLRQEEGWGPETVLREELLRSFGAASAGELLHEFYRGRYPRSQVAQFATVVDRAAAGGDRVADDLLRIAAGQLAGYTRAVRSQLFAKGDSVRIAWAGGVFRCERLRTQFQEILEADPGNVVRPPAYPPVAGALLEAYGAAGLRPVLRDLPQQLK